MIFTSVAYLFFFPIVLLALARAPRRIHWVLLLLASAYFYMVFIPAYILILVFLILVDYAAGLWIERSTGPRRRTVLIGSLVANLGVLGLFKYADFVARSVVALLPPAGVHRVPFQLHWILPLGLSFHTFQSLAYTIDVYRGRQSAERHLGHYALYVMFFPQLVAGPIERPGHLLPQLRAGARFSYRTAVDGLRLIAWGFFLKLAIADRLARFVNPAFADPSRFSGPALAAALIFFSFQIYCDFAGYSAIAIGSARMMGIDLAQNFRQPYLAASPTEFWHRWHITLSQWFRDYVYFPLGGSRVGAARVVFNLLIVFALSGLWHGANWTFAVWGVLHGVLVAAQHLWRRGRPANRAGETTGLAAAAGRVGTFAAVSLLWVFFRASSLAVAAGYLRRMFDPANWSGSLWSAADDFPFPRRDFVLAVGFILLLVGVEAFQQRRPLQAWLSSRPAAVRWSLYYAFLALLIVFARLQTTEFIYFQF